MSLAEITSDSQLSFLKGKYSSDEFGFNERNQIHHFKLNNLHPRLLNINLHFVHNV